MALGKFPALCIIPCWDPFPYVTLHSPYVILIFKIASHSVSVFLHYSSRNKRYERLSN